MSTSVAPLLDHRQETRVAGHSEGRMEAVKGYFPQVGPIVVEEASSGGVRLRSRLQLHPNQFLVLQVPGSPGPIHATVQWVQEVPPGFLGGHKTWIAGCRLHRQSTVRLAPQIRENRYRGMGKVAFQVALLLAGAGAVAYLLLKFASTLG